MLYAPINAPVPGPTVRLMSENQTTILQAHLDRLKAGDAAARNDLLTHATNALARLAKRMFGDFPSVGRWVGVEDVIQNASIRLWKSLEQVRPETVRDFYGLAALQVRRELYDLARHFTGPHGLGANYESVSPGGDETSRPAAADPGHSTLDPGKLALWTDFHREVESLDKELREVFDLLFYQELPQAEAAQVLGISEPTLRRRWLAARLELQKRLKSEPPG